ncbi:MAG: hypothetical protein JW776_01015 [Candidatus Lokiarchaeota archaeon]|nr:hypothetical protein [Candidatus Lokiarchaeota archaeon]
MSDKIDLDHDLILTYFDVRYGPKIILGSLKTKNDGEQPLTEIELTRLMDIHESGDFFIHYYKHNFIANYLFSVKDYTEPRGFVNRFMTSIVFHRDSKISDEDWFHLVFKNIDRIEQSIKKISENLHKNPLIKNLIKVDPNNRSKNVFVEQKSELLEELKSYL